MSLRETSLWNALLSCSVGIVGRWQWRAQARTRLPGLLIGVLVIAIQSVMPATVRAELRAGAARVDITNYEAGPVNDPLHARALVVSDGTTTTAIVSVDAVAIGEIGPIRNDYLGKVRAAVQQEPGIPPGHVLVNASHCHGIVASNVDELTVQAIRQAASRMVPVRAGVAVGHENRIMENRRLRLKDGREVDVRHAYSMPPDDEVASAGPIDAQIGVLKLDALDGATVAVLYNFACHPIQGVPGGGNTADITGFSSQVIEDNLDDGAVALFIQGCAGDINPAFYKHVDHPRHAEPLGNMLGLSTLKAVRAAVTSDDGRLKFVNHTLTLPRSDLASRIEDLEARQLQLAQSLRGTTLSLKTFIPLVVKYRVNEEYPTYYSHSYFNEEMLARDDLKQHDAANRRDIEAYIRNVHTMEELTRLNTNLALLRKHHASGFAAGNRTIDVEVAGLRIGEFVLVTFPGELTVPIGLNIKAASPHPHTFVAGYTNGYIYYSPTAEQLLNVGGAQEDSDCLLAPEWQQLFESRVAEMLKTL